MKKRNEYFALILLILFIGLGAFSVETKADNLFETEDNGTFYTANNLILGNSVIGALTTGYNDKDYYKVTVPANGVISLVFNHLYEDSTNGWNVSIYRKKDGQFCEIGSWDIDLNQGEKSYLPAIGVVKGGEYYILVANQFWGTSNQYVINTSFSQTENWEIEDNDTYYTATNIVLGKSINGALVNGYNDKDYFKIVANDNGTVSLYFKHYYVNSSDGWEVSIIKYLDGQFIKLSNTEIDLRDNEAYKIPSFNVVKGGVYYIVVGNQFWGTGNTYTITTSFASTKKVQTISAKGFNKTYGDNEFSLGAKTSGNGKLTYKSDNTKVVTVSSTGKVKIKGIGVANIKISASATSTYKAATKTVKIQVKPRPTVISSLNNNKSKVLEIKWKKDSTVTGYKIQVSTNSSFSNASTYKITNNTTVSKKISVTKGKTYYVKICTYKGALASKWSNVKKIKIQK